MPILTIDTRTRSSILLSNNNYRLNQLTRVYVYLHDVYEPSRSRWAITLGGDNKRVMTAS
jgi:hypothetical protein